MATPDSIEAVKKVSETVSKQSPAEHMEHARQEHFQSVMSTSQSALKAPTFERVDVKAIAAEDLQRIETQPAFGDDNVTSQQSGSATDQERKGRGQQGETEGVEGVSGASSKESSQATGTHPLMGEVSKLSKNVTQFSNMSPEQIKAQSKEMIAQLENAKSQLSQANTEIKPSYQNLLKNRLSHIDDSLKIALNKAGVEYTPPAPAVGNEKTNAMKKFVDMLTNSQDQINSLDTAIEKFNSVGEITPANMLAIQVKMGYVQQQIELFTSLLNKALESTKTIMNVQV